MCVLLAVSGAHAQPAEFRADYESGTLLQADAPAGDWTSSGGTASAPSVTLAVTPQAARSGSFGMR